MWISKNFLGTGQQTESSQNYSNKTLFLSNPLKPEQTIHDPGANAIKEAGKSESTFGRKTYRSGVTKKGETAREEFRGRGGAGGDPQEFDFCSHLSPAESLRASGGKIS